MPKKYKNKKSKSKIKLPQIFFSFFNGIKQSSPQLISLLVAFFVCVCISLVDFATREQVTQSFVEKYEIGQIADETIYADRTIIPITADGVSVGEGERVIRKGFPISEEQYKKLELLSTTPSKLDWRGYAGTVLYFVLIVSVVIMLCSSLQNGKKLRMRDIVFLIVLFLLVYSIAALLINTAIFSSPFLIVAVVPSSLCIILITILISVSAGNCFSLLFALAMLGAASYNVIPFLYVFVTSLFAVRLVRKMEDRMEFIRVAAILAFVNVAVLFLLALIFPHEHAAIYGGKSVPQWVSYLAVAFNGFISGVLALGFLTPLESLLNTSTVFRLMELSNTNSPIIQKMSTVAMGTYSHSIMVMRLAEEACKKINANAVLARVGALYHDVGKIEQPEYFIENQSGNVKIENANKHNDIKPSLSASIIRSHVKKGEELARQQRLPQEVIKIISEHHGNSVIAYFYNEAKKLDENASIADYSYLGDPPSTKESAVVMLADTVEAACRTLDKPSVPRLEKFIRDLIMKKFEARQLDKSNLSFYELDKIQEVFVDILASHYHSRIEYPDQKDPDEIQNEAKAQVTSTKTGEKD